MFRVKLDHGGSIDAAHFEILPSGDLWLMDEEHSFTDAIAAGHWTAVGVVKGES